MPLIEEGAVDYSGETLSAKAKTFQAPPQHRVRVLVAALGPQALSLFTPSEEISTWRERVCYDTSHRRVGPLA